MNSLLISDVSNPNKISTRQFPIPFINHFNSDEIDMTIDKLFYLSQSETFVLQNSDRISAMHLPQRLFLLR